MPDQFKNITLLDLWYAVLELDVGIGISISSEDKELLRQQLYRTRSESGDEKLNQLAILTPEGKNELWIVRRDLDVRT